MLAAMVECFACADATGGLNCCASVEQQVTTSFAVLAYLPAFSQNANSAAQALRSLLLKQQMLPLAIIWIISNRSKAAQALASVVYASMLERYLCSPSASSNSCHPKVKAPTNQKRGSQQNDLQVCQ